MECGGTSTHENVISESQRHTLIRNHNGDSICDSQRRRKLRFFKSRPLLSSNRAGNCFLCVSLCLCNVVFYEAWYALLFSSYRKKYPTRDNIPWVIAKFAFFHLREPGIASSCKPNKWKIEFVWCNQEEHYSLSHTALRYAWKIHFEIKISLYFQARFYF